MSVWRTASGSAWVGLLLPALLAMAMLAAYAAQAPRAITFGLDDQSFYQYFQELERDPGGAPFRWMGPEGHLDVPRLTLSQQVLSLDLENVRPDREPVFLRLTKDVVARIVVPPGRHIYRLLLPTSMATTTGGLTLGAATFQFPGDRRELSLAIRSATLKPLGALTRWWILTALGLLAQVVLLTLFLRRYRIWAPLLALTAAVIPLQIGLRLNTGYDGVAAQTVWFWTALIAWATIIQSFGFRSDQRMITLHRWALADALLAASLTLGGIILRVKISFYQVPLLIGDDYLAGSFALRILQGQQSLYYGHHTGTLASYLLAPIFAIGGISTSSLLALPILITALLTITLYGLGCDLAGRWGGATAGIWIAFPPITPLVWTMKPQPGYMEAIAFAAVALWLTLRLLYGSYGRGRTIVLMAATALCATLALWAGAVTISVLLACAMVVLIRWRRLPQLPLAGYALMALIGLLLAVPTAIYIVTRPGDNPLWWIFGREVSGLPPGAAFVGLVTQLLPLALGAQSPQLVVQGVGGVSFTILWLAVVAFSYGLLRAIRAALPAILATGFALLIAGMFCFSSFNLLLQDARYILPIYVAYPLLVALLVGAMGRAHGALATLFLALLVIANVWGGAFVLLSNRPPTPRAEGAIARELLGQGVQYVYTTYWIAHPLMVESGGKVLASTLIGPTRAEYDQRVRQAVLAADPAHVAFVMYSGGLIDVPFARYLIDNEITCQRMWIKRILIYTKCSPFPDLDLLQRVLPQGIS